jgi:transmembrane sensor
MKSEQPDPAQTYPERTAQEAIAWFTRMNGEPSSSDRKNFEFWRKSSAANDAAYRKVVASWSATDTLEYRSAGRDAEAIKGYLDVIQKSRKRRGRMVAAASFASVVLVGTLGFHVWRDYPHAFQNLSADHYTARAERKVITLPDGSTVTLDADSAIAQSVDGTHRHVHLLRGAAFFDVAKSAVPFVVEAGGGETRVTGTAFSVETSGEAATVTLARGSVTVTDKSSSRSADLTPGQRISYGDTGMSAVSQVLVDEAMSWRDGRLIFDQTRLGDVLAHIGRYYDGRIVLVGGALSDRAVSGNLPLDDPQSALASLQATVGFRMTHLGSKLIVVGP